MARLTVYLSLTLDGVMQAPGRKDEDTRGGFAHGGWAGPYFDPVMLAGAAEGMRAETALLFGRRTYEDFYSVWPNRKDNPFTDRLNRAQKYVASRTLGEPLPWANSKLLKGEAIDTVRALKQASPMDILVMGSGELLQALMRAGLVDAMTLLIHPLVLGRGTRLFREDGAAAKFKLANSTPTTTGVIIATYQAA